MKTVIFSTAIAALLVSTSLAQNLPQPARVVVSPNSAGGGGEASDEAARFDLKFPGGKVKEFVAAVSKALGRPVNVIIPKEGEATLIPAVDVSRVTVPALFKALSTASLHQVAFVIRSQNVVQPALPGRIPNTSVQFKTEGFTFKTEETDPSPDAVWTFIANNTPDIPAEEPVAPPRTVQYYPVAEYLSHFSVEDITTAIESGWKLQGEAVNPPPTIRFHEETKLLIIAGTPPQMEMIPQVLQGLSQMLRYPRSESLPITRKASQIILPAVKFQDALVTEAVDFIRKKAAELDPDHKGFNIVVDESDGVGERKVTLALNDVPALAALQLLVDLCGMKMETRDHAIVLRERPLQATPAFAPVPASTFPLPGFPAPPTQPAK